MAYSFNVAAAGWSRASPFEHILFLYAGCSCKFSVSWNLPLCISQYDVFACVVCVICRLFLFSLQYLVLSLPITGCPMIWNVGGSRPVPYADVLVGSFVVGSAGGCRSLIIESFFHFLPSPSSNTSLPGSKALWLVLISVVGFLFFLSVFVGGDVSLVKKSLLRFFVGSKLWRQDKLIEVALDLSNTLDKGVTSWFLILSLSPSDFFWMQGICSSSNDACILPTVFLAPLLGGRRHSCPSPVISVAVAGMVFVFFASGGS